MPPSPADGRPPAPREEEIERKVHQLLDLKEGIRHFAEVVELGEKAIPYLERALRGPPDSIYAPRCLVADAIAAIGTQAAASALIRALEDSTGRRLDPIQHEAEIAVTNRVAENLGKSGDRRAAEPLLKALSARPYAGCVRGLTRLREKRSIPWIVHWLSDDFARDSCIDALKEFGDEAKPALLAYLADTHEPSPRKNDGRAAAAYLLGEHPAPDVIEALERSLADLSSEVRLASALVLSKHAPSRHLENLCEILILSLSTAGRVPSSVTTNALVQLGTGCINRLLETALANTPSLPEKRRGAAIETLRNWPSSSWLDRLVELSDDDSPNVRSAAIRLLESPWDERKAVALASFKDDPDPRLRCHVLRVLSAHGSATLQGHLSIALSLLALAWGSLKDTAKRWLHLQEKP